MVAILNSGILNLAILWFSHLSFFFSNSLSLAKIFSHHLHKTFHSFILTELDDGSQLEFCHLEFGHLGFSHLSISSSKSLTLAKIGSHHLHKKISLIHSDSTWWWQPSWILSCWIQTLLSWSQTPCYLLSDSLKNTVIPLWLWLKLIQSDSNSFILTLLDDGAAILNSGHLEFGYLVICHLSIFFQTHSHLSR